jgi:hypothetical protein
MAVLIVNITKVNESLIHDQLFRQGWQPHKELGGKEQACKELACKELGQVCRWVLGHMELGQQQQLGLGHKELELGHKLGQVRRQALQNT